MDLVDELSGHSGGAGCRDPATHEDSTEPSGAVFQQLLVQLTNLNTNLQMVANTQKDIFRHLQHPEEGSAHTAAPPVSVSTSGADPVQPQSQSAMKLHLAVKN